MFRSSATASPSWLVGCLVRIGYSDHNDAYLVFDDDLALSRQVNELKLAILLLAFRGRFQPGAYDQGITRGSQCTGAVMAVPDLT